MSDESAVVYVCVMDGVHWHLYKSPDLLLYIQVIRLIRQDKPKRKQNSVPMCMSMRLIRLLLKFP